MSDASTSAPLRVALIGLGGVKSLAVSAGRFSNARRDAARRRRFTDRHLARNRSRELADQTCMNDSIR